MAIALDTFSQTAFSVGPISPLITSITPGSAGMAGLKRCSTAPMTPTTTPPSRSPSGDVIATPGAISMLMPAPSVVSPLARFHVGWQLELGVNSFRLVSASLPPL